MNVVASPTVFSRKRQEATPTSFFEPIQLFSFWQCQIEYTCPMYNSKQFFSRHSIYNALTLTFVDAYLSEMVWIFVWKKTKFLTNRAGMYLVWLCVSVSDKGWGYLSTGGAKVFHFQLYYLVEITVVLKIYSFIMKYLKCLIFWIHQHTPGILMILWILRYTVKHNFPLFLE